MTGSQLKKRREALSLSQPELAKALGIHSMTLSKWEREVLEVPRYIDLALKTLERENKPHKRKSQKSVN